MKGKDNGMRPLLPILWFRLLKKTSRITFLHADIMLLLSVYDAVLLFAGLICYVTAILDEKENRTFAGSASSTRM